MPYIMERTDYSWGRHKYWCNVNAEKRPSELFREHVYGCFVSDRTGIALRADIIDNIMFESDYPHSDCNWPHTRKLLAEVLADVPDEDARKIVETNARTLYNFWA
jgi:predicted TIM-barrel fold metal-dependent hydrolase